MSNNHFSIAVIIPAYNEEKRLKPTIEAILSYLRDRRFDAEVIVFDDGSKDRTREIAKSFSDRGVMLMEGGLNRGKGYAVRNGMLAASKNWLLFNDADGATPIEELDNFLGHLKEAEILIGSRATDPERVVMHQPWHRRLAGRLFNFLVQWLVIKGIKDTQCGFKLFRRDAAKKIFSRETLNGFGFDTEVLYLAKKFSYRIKELPVAWENREGSKVRLFRDSLDSALDLLRIRLNDLFRRYR